MKKIVKSLGLRLAAAGGLFAVGRVLTRRRFRIFAYHGVSSEIDEGINFDGFFVRPGVFEAHLRTLKGHYHVMPLGEILLRIHAGKTLPDCTAAITFDDGYENNLKEAAPLLAKYGLPATFFVTTGFIDGTHEPWWGTLREKVFSVQYSVFSEACERARRFETMRGGVMPSEVEASPTARWTEDPSATRAAWQASLEMTQGKHRFQTYRPDGEERISGGMQDRVAAVMAWENISKNQSTIRRNECLSELFSILNTEHKKLNTDSWSMMSWDDVQTLTKQGHEIGAHTVSHISLGHESMDVVSREVAGSTERIREMTGKSPSVFSYPYGEKEHFSQELADEVARHGYLGAVTTLEGMNSVSDNPLLLRRFNVTGHHDRYAFRAVASGLKRW